MEEVEVLFHPAFWVVAVLAIIGALFYGFGSNVADRIFGPDEEKVRQECVDRAHADRERCQNGGIGGSVFKTKGRIEKCQEIYEKEVEACG